MKPDMKDTINELPAERFQQIRPKKNFNDKYFSKREMKLLKDISFIFNDAKAEDMVESTHLKNEPWDRTLKEKGKFEKIDYMLSIDSETVSLPYDEAKERVEEISEVYQLFGVD